MCGRFWDSIPGPIPVHHDEGGEIVCRDARTGRELSRSQKTLGPNGQELQIFEAHPAVCIADVGDPRGKKNPRKWGHFFPKGTKVEAGLYPGGGLVILHGSVILSDSLVLGKDVDWV